jgi:cytochrome c oxidase subunit IV
MSEHIVPPKVYATVWAALLILLVATVALAYIPLGPLHVVVAISIAFAKAILIVLFFMHVRYKQPLVIVFVCAGLFWLAIMFTLALGDYMTRSWLPHPSQWTGIAQ